MTQFPEGNAIVYCQDAFNTPNGKTAHGLVRKTARYRVLSVVDSRYAGQDAGEVLDGSPNGIPVLQDIPTAYSRASREENPATHLVIGLAPDGGRLPEKARTHIIEAVGLGLHIDSGLHDFLSEDETIATLAREKGVRIRDIRKPPDRSRLHFFSGKIEKVESTVIALLGTDSAVGKRTTAWILVEALRRAGFSAEMIGTGQTAWMQGVTYGIVLDSLINDFVAGEIEHAVWLAWQEARPDVIVLEGQGSLMNPAYPGGFELLAAGRPDFVILQHAPRRLEYDGFPGYPLHPLKTQIQAVELLSGKPVAAITLNHELMASEEIEAETAAIGREIGLPCFDVLIQGGAPLVKALLPRIRGKKP